MAGTTPQSISSLIGVNQPASPGSSKSNGSAIDPNEFLTLLTTELQNQDPTQPTDPTQSVTQLAQFSALQYQQQLSSSFANFQGTFGVMQAASLIGKEATVEETSATTSNSTTVTGTINSISVQNGQPYFTMTGSDGKTIADNNGNPLLFSTQNIVGIGTAASTTTSSGG
ncbi:MAG TPA: flagellar hook capping FlgD N-terminal domain-containing protein [Candidatus Baltobacteraceae bacterium]|nr:flagellar hook capping FlgD N-terminal domain-containing protein [Candidatus Baltobacteraceae bacterium]